MLSVKKDAERRINEKPMRRETPGQAVFKRSIDVDKNYVIRVRIPDRQIQADWVLPGEAIVRLGAAAIVRLGAAAVVLNRNLPEERPRETRELGGGVAR